MADPLEQSHIASLLYDISNPVIVELGAHIGEDEDWIRPICKSLPHYIMVEPDSHNVKFILKKPTFDDRKVIVGAISDIDGEKPFHFCQNTQESDMWSHTSGSLRKPKLHLVSFPFVLFDKVSMVKTYTLDTIFNQEKLKNIDLLWVDIQASERDMIVGGKIALQHTHYLFMEAEDAELYEGEASKKELINMLPGWSLIYDFGYNILLQNDKYKCQ